MAVNHQTKGQNLLEPYTPLDERLNDGEYLSHLIFMTFNTTPPILYNLVLRYLKSHQIVGLGRNSL
jgi:hypothetical protein